MNQTHPLERLTPTTLTQLRALEAVARHGSFKAAARELYVSPSAISHHVRHLESTLGVPLLTRERHGTAVTPASTELIDATNTAFTMIAAALARLATQQQRTTTVTVTVAPFFSAHWLAPRRVIRL